MGLDIGILAPYAGVIVIALAVIITVLVIVQSKGNDLSGFLGGESSNTFRTKRGIEATIHRITIYTSAAFFLLTVIAFIAWGQV